MVVWLHTTLPWGMSQTTEGVNKELLHVFEVIAIPAVDIFVLISGYYMASKNERGVGKPISLLLQMTFLGVLCFLPVYLSHYPLIPFSISVLLPNNYFITLYVALYFISPYINKAIRGLTLRQCNTLLIISTTLLSIYPILWDYIHLYTSLDIDGISTVSRWNNDYGQNIATFSLVYTIGVLIRQTELDKRIKSVQALLLWGAVTAILLLMYYIDERYTEDVFGCVSLYYHNPLVIIQAASLFLVFKGTKIRSNIINKLASAAFTCYLIHGMLLGKFRMVDFLQKGPVVLIIYYIALAIIVYLLSYPIYLIYDYSTKWLINRLDKFKIHYYD